MLLSSIHGLMRNKKEKELTVLALKAKAGDEKVMNDLLKTYGPFMKKTASFVCKRYIDEQDDEFSVAMTAFYEAVQKFEETKNASLTTFAHLMIKRRLIDYIRKEARRNETVIFIKEYESDDGDTDHEWIYDGASIDVHTEEERAAERREEILQYNSLLKEYGLSFAQLSEIAPKHESTRKTAFQIAQIVAETPEFYNYVLEQKRLPIKELESLVEVSRKTIERQRKYILAVVILLKSELLYLKEYIKGEILL